MQQVVTFPLHEPCVAENGHCRIDVACLRVTFVLSWDWFVSRSLFHSRLFLPKALVACAFFFFCFSFSSFFWGVLWRLQESLVKNSCSGKTVAGNPSAKPSEVGYVELHLINAFPSVALRMQERRVCSPTYILVSGRNF